MVIETEQKLASMSLTTAELLSEHKVFYIFIICDYIDKIGRAF